MSLSNPKTVVTEERLKEFYESIYPYLGKQVESGFTPVGTVIAVMGTTAPANYVACDGSVLNIADYKELAQYFETQFGTKNHFGGNGTTTFAVPDLRGEFLRGTGTNSHANQGSGANVGEHQDGTIIPTYRVDQDFVISISSTDTLAVQDEDKRRDSDLADGRRWKSTSSMFSSSDSYTEPSLITSRPTNTSVLYCIAIKNIYMGSSGVTYSEDEQVVGTWIDGKPLYQKTVYRASVGKSATERFGTGIANIDKVVEIGGTYKFANDAYPLGTVALGEKFTYTGTEASEYSSDLSCKAIISASNTEIELRNASSYTFESDVYITLKYTKTTD